MEFGEVSMTDLNKINFTLPKEPSFNKGILSGKKAKKPKIYVGCAKWGRPDWIGKIYPKGTREKDFLPLYIDEFNSIELNATGYKMPSDAQVKMWFDKAKEKDFLYCPKLTRYIVPGPDKEKVQRYLSQFLEVIKGFGKKLGPSYLVLPNYSPEKAKFLYEFLFDYPKNVPLFLELRHEGWFNNKAVLDELIKELSVNNIGLIITDTACRRDVAPMYLTTPKAFIRFVGNSLHPSDFVRCDDWVNRIKYWLKNGLEELYFFMHMHHEEHSPELVIYFIEKLNKECGLDLMVPEWKGEKGLKFDLK
jgi:uncharacterized protein YecE (DUF72 family)